MKKLLSILAVAFIMAACSSPMRHATYFLDYAQAGGSEVFISEANTVNFDYTPLGSIIVEETPGMVTVRGNVSEKENKRMRDDIYGEESGRKNMKVYSNASTQSALNYAVQEVKAIGGDGLINLKFSTQLDKNSRVIVVISGMVIKRK